jgi:hypothetical protein
MQIYVSTACNECLDIREPCVHPLYFPAEQTTLLPPWISIVSTGFEAHSTTEGSLRLCYSIPADRSSRDSSSRRTARSVDISRPDPLWRCMSSLSSGMSPASAKDHNSPMAHPKREVVFSALDNILGDFGFQREEHGSRVEPVGDVRGLQSSALNHKLNLSLTGTVPALANAIAATQIHEARGGRPQKIQVGLRKGHNYLDPDTGMTPTLNGQVREHQIQLSQTQSLTNRSPGDAFGCPGWQYFHQRRLRDKRQAICSPVCCLPRPDLPMEHLIMMWCQCRRCSCREQ